MTGSRISGQMYEFDDKDYRDNYTELGPAITHMWDWLWKGGPEEGVHAGIGMIRAAIQGDV